MDTLSSMSARRLSMLTRSCVTLRDRDTMEQTRVPVADLCSLLEDKVSITSLLKKL